MIKLYVQNYCHDCPEFEPDVKKDTIYSENYLMGKRTPRTQTAIYCKHRDRCASMIEFLEERKKNDGFSARTE